MNAAAVGPQESFGELRQKSSASVSRIGFREFSIVRFRTKQETFSSFCDSPHHDVLFKDQNTPES